MKADKGDGDWNEGKTRQKIRSTYIKDHTQDVWCGMLFISATFSLPR